MLFLLLAGCGASTGMERSVDATTTMQTVENDIQRIVVQLNVTGQSLDNLVSFGNSDVKKAFDTFTAEVEKIENMENSFSAHANEMQARGKDYFEEWKQEGAAYSNPEIQALSDQRRAELGEVYGRIATNSVGVKTAFKTYVSDLNEIRTYLSNDLTSKGIDAIAEVSRRVVRDGADLKYAIKNMQSAIEDVKNEMAQTR
jgi:phage shock protein A